MKSEAQFQTAYGKWAKHNQLPPLPYELKFTTKNRIPFSNIADHQHTNLLANTEKTTNYKIADVGYDKKPYDGYLMKSPLALLGFMYYTPGNKQFVLIKVQDWLKERETSKEKSLTKERAYEIGYVYELGKFDYWENPIFSVEEFIDGLKALLYKGLREVQEKNPKIKL